MVKLMSLCKYCVNDKRNLNKANTLIVLPKITLLPLSNISS